MKFEATDEHNTFWKPFLQDLVSVSLAITRVSPIKDKNIWSVTFNSRDIQSCKNCCRAHTCVRVKENLHTCAFVTPKYTWYTRALVDAIFDWWPTQKHAFGKSDAIKVPLLFGRVTVHKDQVAAWYNFHALLRSTKIPTCRTIQPLAVEIESGPVELLQRSATAFQVE